MKLPLDQIEARLRALIESSVQLLPGSNRQDLLARLLVSSVNDAFRACLDDDQPPPSAFTIYAHPDNLPYWQAQQELFDSLAVVIQELTQEAGMSNSAPVTFRAAEDANLFLEEIRIVSVRQTSPVEQTDAIETPAIEGSEMPAKPEPTNPFLIIGGKQVVPLQQAVVNIGRRLDNHLVIDDPRVSRHHAQLRAVRGRYLVFDLNSTGGTFVNGQRITQHSLKPGDVISLAGYAIIYGEDHSKTTGETGGQTSGISSSPE